MVDEVIKPFRLKHGDTVGIISPSSFVMKSDIREGIKTLKSLGFKVCLSPHALKKRYGYQAGTPDERVSDFNQMFKDPEIRGIFCTTGGYSSMQILPDIDWDCIRKNPKVFVGYSDITVLLNAIHKKTGLVTFHGPLVEGFGKYMNGGNVYTIDSLENAVMKGKKGKLSSYTLWRTLKAGKAIGSLVGGNLNILYSLIGTEYEPDFKGKILFIEEIDDTDESVEHYLWRLRIAGIFQKIRGMIIGKFNKIYLIKRDGSVPRIRDPFILKKMFARATEGFDFPILYGVDFGHYVPSLTLPIGAKVLLDCPKVNIRGSISILGGYVK